MARLFLSRNLEDGNAPGQHPPAGGLSPTVTLTMDHSHGLALSPGQVCPALY
jgi:hypothetical protein